MRPRYNRFNQHAGRPTGQPPQNDQQLLPPTSTTLNPCASNWNGHIPMHGLHNQLFPQMGYFPLGIPGGWVLQGWNNHIMDGSASMQPGGNFLYNAGLAGIGQVMPVQYSPLPMALANNLAPQFNQFVQAPGGQHFMATDGCYNGLNQICNPGFSDAPVTDDTCQMFDPRISGTPVANGTNQMYNPGVLDNFVINGTDRNFMHFTDPQQQMINSSGNGGYNHSNFKFGNFHGQNNASSRVSGSKNFNTNYNERSLRHWSGRKGHPKRGKSNLFKYDKEIATAGSTSTTVTVNYTAEEVKKWREERKKNFPTKANIEKRFSEKESSTERERIRRQQLREILKKQAELGVEVAELPPNYFSESENLGGRQENPTVTHKNVRGWQHKKANSFRNKFDSRNRNEFKGRPNKRQKSDCTLPNAFPSKKASLLEKLLSSDIKREKSHLLQAFRFMVLNSFFKEWPEKAMEFPLVDTKDCIGETYKAEQLFALADDDLLDGGNLHDGVEIEDQIVIDEDVDFDDDGYDEVNTRKLLKSEYVEDESEEGEITD